MKDSLYTIAEIHDKIAPIAESFGLDRVYLFGSYARGDATEMSDIDLRIDKGKVRGLAFGNLIDAISDSFSKKVDIVPTGCLSIDFLNTISKEEILLYGMR